MINKVILMGRLVADPELRKTQSDISVCRFRIAVNRPYQKDKENTADFISCTAWRNTADFISRYFTKGKMIIVEGSLRNDNYTDANNVKHYSMDVQVDNVSFGESKNSSDPNSFRVLDDNAAPAPAPARASSLPAADETLSLGDMGDFEEILSDGDVPF